MQGAKNRFENSLMICPNFLRRFSSPVCPSPATPGPAVAPQTRPPHQTVTQLSPRWRLTPSSILVFFSLHVSLGADIIRFFFLYHGYVVPERCPHCFPSVLANHQCCCDMLILIMVGFFLFKVPSILSAFLLSTPQNFVSKNAACITMLFRMQFGMFQSH